MPFIFEGSHTWKETQMGKQTYTLTSGGLYDNDYTHNITLLLASSANTDR